MADLITFVIDGSQERRGAIPAEDFLAKLREFINTIYAFERTFSGKQKRQIDLEIVDLQRSSPGSVKMRARAKVIDYPVEPPLEYAFEQLDNLANGRPIDARIPQNAIDNVVELATMRASRLPALSLVRVEYGAHVIDINERLANQALAIRAKLKIDVAPPWRAGISRGSIFGELRGVSDFDGERQFFVVPPSGPTRVQCIFPETLRAEIVAHLFRPCRVVGFLHYDGTTPHAHLIEAEEIHGVKEPEGHFADIGDAYSERLPDQFESLGE